ncbi:MAG: hypothetical protein LBK73_02660 [Treponema sp.]|jgi:hypothetical protein|nr:hypothetical protein [Treponema sp.]
MSVKILIFAIDFSVSYYDAIDITDDKLFYHGFDGREEEYDITWENIGKNEYITFNYTREYYL